MDKSITVIQLASDTTSSGLPFFQNPPENSTDPQCPCITLDRQIWEEMGKPTVITVTVQPGDHLN